MCLPDLLHQLSNRKLHVQGNAPNGYGWNKPTNWKQQKKPSPRPGVINIFQWSTLRCSKKLTGIFKEDVLFFRWAQNLRCLRIIHGHLQVNHGAVWTCFPAKPYDAPRMCDVCSFGPGNLWGKKEDETQKHPGGGGMGWCKVGNATKALEVVGWFISHWWHGPQLVSVRLILEW